MRVRHRIANLSGYAEVRALSRAFSRVIRAPQVLTSQSPHIFPTSLTQENIEPLQFLQYTPGQASLSAKSLHRFAPICNTPLVRVI